MNAQAACAAAAALAHPSSVWDTLVSAHAAKCPAAEVAWPFMAVGTCVLPVLMVQGDLGALGKATEGAMGTAPACTTQVLCEGFSAEQGVIWSHIRMQEASGYRAEEGSWISRQKCTVV